MLILIEFFLISKRCYIKKHLNNVRDKVKLFEFKV